MTCSYVYFLYFLDNGKESLEWKEAYDTSPVPVREMFRAGTAMKAAKYGIEMVPAVLILETGVVMAGDEAFKQLEKEVLWFFT